MTRAALTVCVLSAVVAIGCAEDSPESSRAPDPEPATKVAAPSNGCRPLAVARLLDDLFDALNRGDDAAAAALLVDREMLTLLKRPAAGRPLRLLAVIVGVRNGLGHIEFHAVRRRIGKGAVDCETRRFVAVGLGAAHERMPPLCDGRRACARHWSD